MIADASNIETVVNHAFVIIVSICVFFLLLITVLMVVFVIKYSRKKNKKPKNIHGNVPLELTWTLIPTLIVIYMFWLGWTGYQTMSSPPKDAMVIHIDAQMWKWTFHYDNGATSDTLYVPLNKPIRVDLHSKDVDHSFFVPAFRVKKDVIPTRHNFTWFKPEKIGEYQIECAQYCGLGHSQMLAKLVVLSQDKFAKWLNSKAAKQDTSKQVAANQ
jgi:cytochrome c oxidase subunit 2